MKNIALALTNVVDREALSVLLNDNYMYSVVHEAKSLEDFTTVSNFNSVPDLIITELGLYDHDNGILHLKIFKEKYPSVKILVIDTCENPEAIHKGFKFGIDGYLLKSAELEELQHCIKEIFAGKRILSNELALQWLYQFAKTEAEANEAENFIKPLLTHREYEILSLIAEGLTNCEIAEKIFMSRRTVEGHRSNLLKKLHVKNSAELVKCAYNLGLIGKRAS